MKKRTWEAMTALMLCINLLLASCIQANAAAVIPDSCVPEVDQSKRQRFAAETVTVANPLVYGTANEISAVSLEESPKQNNHWGIVLTEEEIDLLAKIVWLEASGESVEGQQAVVEVIFNRMASSIFPDALYDVLSQKRPLQFSSWPHRDVAKPTDKEYNSIYSVLAGETDLLREDTLYFSTTMQTSNLDVEIGGHSFCY